jgi:hypothetical protein
MSSFPLLIGSLCASACRFRALTAESRQEFIFRILKHLTIGGGMCQVACTRLCLPTHGFSEFFNCALQFDDEWKPYADTVLAM